MKRVVPLWVAQLLVLIIICGFLIGYQLRSEDVIQEPAGGQWEYRWVMQPCMRSLLLGDIQTLGFREPDTCWQQERYWVSDVDTTNGNWYMQLRFEDIDLTIKIRLDTLWQMAESVWIERR